MAIDTSYSIDKRPSNSDLAQTIKKGESIGARLDKAEDDLLSAIKSGDRDRIAKAQVLYDKAKELWQMFVAFLGKSGELSQQIIQAIGR